MRQRGLRRASAFSLPRRLWRGDVLRCVDLHCGGEPATVVLGKDVPGATMEAKRQHIMRHEDAWRRLLLHEPRGYPCSNVDFLLAPTVAEADYGFVIAEQDAIYPLMSGHNTICVATALVECGLLPEDRRERFVLEAPSGPVPIRTELAADGRCASVTFDGPPSFVAVRDEVVQLDPDACRALGLAAAEVRIDVAYGGMWYAIADAPTGAKINAVAATPYIDGVGSRRPRTSASRSTRGTARGCGPRASSSRPPRARSAPCSTLPSTIPVPTSWPSGDRGAAAPSRRTRSSCPTATQECWIGAPAGAARVRSWRSSTRGANSI